MEESLRKRLEFICKFCRVKLVIINGNLRTIDKTNLTYLEPHRIIINDITFLSFNYSNEIFIVNLNNKIKLSKLENYIEMKKQLERNAKNLEIANKESSELKQNSKDIKDKIDKLKTSKLNKDNYILSKEIYD